MVTDHGYSSHYLCQKSGIVTLPTETTHTSCSSRFWNEILSDSPFGFCSLRIRLDGL